MISSIASHGYQSLHSSPAISINSQQNIPSGEKEEENQRPSPAVSDSQKIKPTVSSQENQAQQSGKKKEGQQNGEVANVKKAVSKPNSPTELDEEQLKEVQALKQRDIEVRAHEAAHLAAAGQHAQGGAKFTLKRGPDGKSYAIGGSVSIDTSPEADPESTIRKADQIKRAALAPAEPSGQDRSVAAQAATMKIEAQAKLAEEQRAQTDEGSSRDGKNQSDPVESGSPVTASPQDNTKDETLATSPPEAKSGLSATQTSCEICGGNHPTGPHLESNQRKTSQYTTISQA